MQQESEPEGYEFGYYTFDTLPALEVSNIETSSNTTSHVDDTKNSNNVLWELPINNKTLAELQQKDRFCNNILKQIEKGNLKEGQLYVIKDNILKMLYMGTIVMKQLSYQELLLLKYFRWHMII